jgi:hypothetical protein
VCGSLLDGALGFDALRLGALGFLGGRPLGFDPLGFGAPGLECSLGALDLGTVRFHAFSVNPFGLCSLEIVASRSVGRFVRRLLGFDPRDLGPLGSVASRSVGGFVRRVLGFNPRDLGLLGRDASSFFLRDSFRSLANRGLCCLLGLPGNAGTPFRLGLQLALALLASQPQFFSGLLVSSLALEAFALCALGLGSRGGDQLLREPPLMVGPG